MLVPKSEKVSSLLPKEDFVNAVRTNNGVNNHWHLLTDCRRNNHREPSRDTEVVNKFREDHLYIDAVILEGVGKYINAIADAVDLRKLDSENVSVVIAQDPAQAAKMKRTGHTLPLAAHLECCPFRYVHENMGSVDIENHPRDSKGIQKSYPLTNKLKRDLAWTRL